MAILPNLARSIGKAFKAALLPQDCLVCGAGSAERLLCPACEADLPRLPAVHCPLCALPTPDGEICGTCLKAPPHFDATLAVFAYAFPVDRLIQALKYQHRLALTHYFGEALAAVAHDTADVLLPLPLHPQRLRQRGFNQAVEIARPLAHALRLPLALDAVTRDKDATPQASLPWKERRRNVRNAFLCRVDLSGRRVLVVDDVMTTGATLDELARSLKQRGAARVTNLVVARTLPH